MGTVALNLSRKWRSQNFDQIVGQDLAVRILKNSLYLGHYFPVYLFAGQRGCGKTSTARIFAAALNCEQLEVFQKDPKKISVPCLACSSCKAMQSGSHPDFIEIDAASHTGVDNMRNIIESSSLLPIMGRKRVYLVDEAHMLSKAAFNAALKILEEPPATAVFILATTNPQKIIDTVRSRCFQLFFSPVLHDPLKRHLQMVCSQENIVYEDSALDIIIRQTEGSVRDALNMLEQVRFSSSVINKIAVLKLLGHINDRHVLDIIITTLQGSAVDVLNVLQKLSLDNYSAEFVWQRLMTLLRALIWAKHGINVEQLVACSDDVVEYARHCALNDLHRMAESLYLHEELFVKTTTQHSLLEMILLGLCQKDKKKIDGGSGSAPCAPPMSAETLIENAEGCEGEEQDEEGIEESAGNVNQWTSFVNQMVVMNHPIISSLFKQSRLVAYDQEQKKLTIEFAKELNLFKEWLDTTRDVWVPLLHKIFAAPVQIDAHFTGVSKIDKNSKSHNDRVDQEVPQRSVEARSPVIHHKEKTTQGSSGDQVFGGGYYKKKVTPAQNSEARIDVSQEEEWPIASMLLRHFPGVVTEMRENR